MDQESASLEHNKAMDIEVLDEAGSLVTITSLRQENTLNYQDIHEESPHILPAEFFFVHNGKHVMKRWELQIKCKELEGNRVHIASYVYAHLYIPIGLCPPF
ncbi:hypothetical protein GOP47_0025306 [Adiantum capillus-veneris]|uniref:Uncharacterized protein n=1 Tax=Adiantum capillus-veneris TaxID=13818 RepID=A0A9D4Z3H1_ADICA|nr:hypothetical protein GOP47_0025306 [Adiantum capillus-veneris]